MSAPFPAEVILLLVLLLGAAGFVAFLVLRRSSEDPSARGGRWGRAGCVAVGLAGIALVALWIRSQREDLPLSAPVELVIRCDAAEIFLGDRWVGRERVRLDPELEGSGLPDDVAEGEEFAALFPAATPISTNRSIFSPGEPGQPPFQLRTLTAILREPSGEYDTVALLVFERGIPPGRSVVVLRARRAGGEKLVPGSARRVARPRTVFHDLLGLRSSPVYEVELFLTPDLEGRRFRVDDFETSGEAPR